MNLARNCYRLAENPLLARKPLGGRVNPSCNTTTQPGRPASRPQSSLPSSLWRSPPRRRKKERLKPTRTAASSGAPASTSTRGAPRLDGRSVPGSASRARPTAAGPWPIAVVSALLLLPTSSAQEGGGPQGDFLFDDSSLQGAFAVAGNASAMLLRTGAAPQLNWRAEGDLVVVNSTSVPVVEVDKTSGDPLITVTREKATQEESSFSKAVVVGSSTGVSAHVLVAAETHASMILNVTAASMAPPTDAAWMAGSQAGAVAAQPGPTQTLRRYDVPAGALEIRPRAGTVALCGHLSLTIWQTRVGVETRSESRTFESGVETTGPILPGLVAERRYVLLVITVEDGCWTAPIEAATPAQLVGPSFRMGGHGIATFHDADGLLHNRSQQTVVLRETVTANGGLDALVWNQTSSGSLRAQISVSYGSIGTASHTFAPTLAAGKRSDPLWPWWLLLAILPTLAAAIWYAGRPPVRIDDVEWALLNGRPGKGERLARRLLQSRPRDPDLVFLFATALVTRAQHERALDLVEPMAKRLPKSQRRGVAFVLAAAARAIGNEGKTRRWAREASAEPALLAQMVKNGLWKSRWRRDSPARGFPALQTGYA